ncbi:hypothetical protein Q3G72_018003 [Acer saccharum]|nr:hypothetical protein Q3G72_018003 [Acer saccharum]
MSEFVRFGFGRWRKSNLRNDQIFNDAGKQMFGQDIYKDTPGNKIFCRGLWLSAKTLNFISVIEGDCNLESHFFLAVL